MSESSDMSFDKNPTPIKHRAEWRYLENGKYDNRPIDKDYFRKYMAVRVECSVCGKMVLRGDLSKHKKRSICINNS
jgi:formylmethanofuran dehydrogenase subunit E